MQKIFFIFVVIFSILTPAMVGYVKKSKEVSSRSSNYEDYLYDDNYYSDLYY